MSECKQTFNQGADGRLYFTFNLYAEYEMRPPYSENFNYRIVACEFDEVTETEYYRIESADEELPARYTVSQIKLMLSQLPYGQTVQGDLVELPLLVEEVKAFFTAKRQALNKANVTENEKVKGTAWNTNLKVLKGIRENLCYALSQNDQAKVSELGAKLAEIEAEQNKILEDKGVNLRILTKATDCAECGDTGITCGKICACARKRTDEIKIYNALKRLAAKMSPSGDSRKATYPLSPYNRQRRRGEGFMS